MKPTIILFLLFIFTLPTLAIAQTGDFNGDGLWNCDDADALAAETAAGTNNPAFDLDGDGLVNAADLISWLALAGAENLPSGDPYPAGDANLDGVIDSIDYNTMYDHIGMTGVGYCGGDFNGDGIVDLIDTLILCNNAPPTFCDTVVATEQSNWGAVKAIFR
jgi:hypothetical protein